MGSVRTSVFKSNTNLVSEKDVGLMCDSLQLKCELLNLAEYSDECSFQAVRLGSLVKLWDVDVGCTRAAT